MNDPEEGSAIINEEVSQHIKDFYGKKSSYTGTDYYLISLVNEKLNKNNKIEESQVSENLLLWRLYGDDAKGAKIIFPENLFNKYDMHTKITSGEDMKFPLTLYEVNYLTKEIKQELNKRLNKVLKNIHDKINNGNKKKIKKAVRLILDEIRFLYKAEAYKFEEEYRIIWLVPQNHKGIKVDLNQIPAKKYLEINSENTLCNPSELQRLKDCHIYIGTATHKKEIEENSIKHKIKNLNCTVKTSTLKYSPK